MVLALLASSIGSIKGGLIDMGKPLILNGNHILMETLTSNHIIGYHQIHVLKPKVLMGLFVGSMASSPFCRYRSMPLAWRRHVSWMRFVALSGSLWNCRKQGRSRHCLMCQLLLNVKCFCFRRWPHSFPS